MSSLFTSTRMIVTVAVGVGLIVVEQKMQSPSQ